MDKILKGRILRSVRLASIISGFSLVLFLWFGPTYINGEVVAKHSPVLFVTLTALLIFPAFLYNSFRDRKHKVHGI